MTNYLFWDFHGTLTYPDKLWSTNVHRTAQELLPDCRLTLDEVSRALDNDGFPWNHPERTYTDITEPDAWWAYVSRLFYTTYRRCGLSDAQAGFLAPQVRPRIVDSRNFHLYENAKDMLDALTHHGWRHMLLSNHIPELELLCRELGIAGCFDGFVVSALAGYDKPRREIYDLALERAGHPDSCFMIGDNPVADIQGAKDAGIRAILVNNPRPSGADHTCADLEAVKALLLGAAVQ